MGDSPPRLPREKDKAYTAFAAWCAQPQRPRSVPALVASGVASNTNARRWRTQHAWDSRAAAWDLRAAGGADPTEAPEWPAGDDPVHAARLYAQRGLPEYLAVLHTAATDVNQKPHLRVASALALVELAGVTKLSRPKGDPSDPLKAARALADTVAGKIDPDTAMELLHRLGSVGADG